VGSLEGEEWLSRALSINNPSSSSEEGWVAKDEEGSLRRVPPPSC